MKRSTTLIFFFVGLVSLFHAQAQVTLPPNGDNQKSSITQHLGLVTVTVDYSSPDVDGREGKVWGQLVPYGPTDFVATGFGTATAAPWRAGANENTTITFSQEVLVQGQKLAAGTYGLHVMTQKEGPWEVIFSQNSTSWGSYFYDPAEDVLRVKASPIEAPFQEYLTYEFTERKQDTATLTLKWENLALPVEITVEDGVGLYVAQIRNEMRNSAGFSPSDMRAAAAFCLQHQRNLEEALQWIEMALNHPFFGERNFAGMQLKTQLLYALAQEDAAKKTLAETVKMPAEEMPLFQFGIDFVQTGKLEAAKTVFAASKDQYPESWTTYSGWGLVHNAEGDKKEALKQFEKAKAVAPPFAMGFIESQIAGLKN